MITQKTVSLLIALVIRYSSSSDEIITVHIIMLIYSFFFNIGEILNDAETRAVRCVYKAVELILPWTVNSGKDEKSMKIILACQVYFKPAAESLLF